MYWQSYDFISFTVGGKTIKLGKIHMMVSPNLKSCLVKKVCPIKRSWQFTIDTEQRKLAGFFSFNFMCSCNPVPFIYISCILHLFLNLQHRIRLEDVPTIKKQHPYESKRKLKESLYNLLNNIAFFFMLLNTCTITLWFTAKVSTLVMLKSTL